MSIFVDAPLDPLEPMRGDAAAPRRTPAGARAAPGCGRAGEARIAPGATPATISALEIPEARRAQPLIDEDELFPELVEDKAAKREMAT